MTKKFVYGGFYQPFWPADRYTTQLLNSSVPSGVTFQTTVPHPFAAIGEQCLKFDGNDATSHLWNTAVHRLALGEDTDYPGSGSGPPDSTLSWALRHSALLRLDATLPSSAALLIDTAQTNTGIGLQLWETTAGLAKLVNKATGATIATGLALPTDATFYQMEIWERFKNSSGANLSDHQFVVRYGTLAAPPAYTTLINATGATSTQGGGGGVLGFGETTQRGAGFVFYVCNPVCGWENADDPYGLVRIDRLDPDGAGHLDSWPGNFTNIDESGTAVPNDADFDSVVYVTGKENELYTLTGGQTAASDTILRASEWQRYDADFIKNHNQTWQQVISDGTNDRLSPVLAPTTAFVENRADWHKNAANAAWAQTDIAGLQAGQHITDTLGAATFRISVLTVTILYEKSGETGTALPALIPNEAVWVPGPGPVFERPTVRAY